MLNTSQQTSDINSKNVSQLSVSNSQGYGINVFGEAMSEMKPEPLTKR